MSGDSDFGWRVAEELIDNIIVAGIVSEGGEGGGGRGGGGGGGSLFSDWGFSTSFRHFQLSILTFNSLTLATNRKIPSTLVHIRILME